MVINKILKKLTPEKIRKVNEEVQNIKLPPLIKKWVKEYEKVGERDEFIWKWTYLNMQNLTLPTVLKKYRKSVLIAKLSSIILNVLVDDLADKRKNKKMLEFAFNTCFTPKNFREKIDLSNFKKRDQRYLNLIRRIWYFLNRTIKKYPRYKDFKDIFLFDYQQFFNSIIFGYLLNKNFDLINLTEYQIYLSPNMQGMVGVTIDLMASPTFDKKEIGLLRELIWQAQRMGRIGNSITTWKREISENDFSSEIFAYALKKNILSKNDLKNSNKEKIIKKIEKTKVQNYFLNEWENSYKAIENFNKKIKSIDTEKFLNGLKKLIIMHLSSVGFK